MAKAKAVKKAEAKATEKTAAKSAAPKIPSHEEGKVFVLKCSKCDFTKTRAYRSDMLGWERDHKKEHATHTMTITTAKATEKPAKKAPEKRVETKKVAAPKAAKKEVK